MKKVPFPVDFCSVMTTHIYWVPPPPHRYRVTWSYVRFYIVWWVFPSLQNNRMEGADFVYSFINLLINLFVCLSNIFILNCYLSVLIWVKRWFLTAYLKLSLSDANQMVHCCSKVQKHYSKTCSGNVYASVCCKRTLKCDCVWLAPAEYHAMQQWFHKCL